MAVGAHVMGAWVEGLAVAGGAAAGGLLRWRVALWLNTPNAALPLGTWAVNCVGGLLIGLAMALLAPLPQALPRLLLVTGFLGGFTTFSAFSAESLGLLLQGAWGDALLHAGAHVAGALACTAAGFALGQALQARAGAA